MLPLRHIGKKFQGSGFAEIVVEAGICACGSLKKVMSGKHYNRALRVHKLFVEGLERLLLKRFDSVQTISEETHTMLQNLEKDPSNINLEHILDSDQYHAYFNRYHMFQDSIRRGEMGNTAQFCAAFSKASSHERSPT